MNLEQERILVTESARGDQRAFADLVRHMAPDLIRTITGIVRDADLAEELAQESFMRAWRNMDRLRDPTSFRCWLWQIARCAAMDALRTRFRRLPEPESLGEVGNETLVAPESPADLALDRRELAQATLASMAALTDDAAEILRLRYEHELSYRDMAERLGLNVVQVKARLARARSALKARLTTLAAEWRRLDDERT